MAKPEKSSKDSWLGDILPIALAVVVVVAAAFGFQMLYADKAASKEDFSNAEREAFLKKHYPLDLTSAQKPDQKTPAAANSH